MQPVALTVTVLPTGMVDGQTALPTPVSEKHVIAAREQQHRPPLAHQTAKHSTCRLRACLRVHEPEGTLHVPVRPVRVQSMITEPTKLVRQVPRMAELGASVAVNTALLIVSVGHWMPVPNHLS
jgi:hypothetical protein